MRLTPAIAIAAAGYSNEFSPPPSSAAAVTCDPHHNCSTWRPYGSSKDFEANAAMIIIVLLTAIICALALNAAIRCSSRYSRTTSSDTNAQGRPRKPNMVELVSDAQIAEPPKLVFSAGMKLAGAAAECAICLSEFVEGEGIRVLGDCNHGFHVHCIQQWLSSNSSCPTCRSTATCLPSLSSTSASNSPTGPNSAPVMANS